MVQGNFNALDTLLYLLQMRTKGIVSDTPLDRDCGLQVGSDEVLQLGLDCSSLLMHHVLLAMS